MAVSKYIRLAGLMYNEWRTPQALAALQARKLRRLVEHAYDNVPFYRDLFRAAGAKPGDIRTAADLAGLPVVDKDMLRAQPLAELVDRRLGPEKIIERHTSGSSGSPFRFAVDEAYDQHCKAQYLRPYLSNGRSIGDRVVHFTAWTSTPTPWFTRAGLLRSRRVDGSLPADKLLEALRSANADIIQGYPSVLSGMASRIDPARRGFRPPRMVFTDSELLAPDARRRIEAAFGAPVYDVYGTFETDNVGYECSEHSGYHLAIDCAVFEFVRGGRPVAAGESGNVVCTVLHNLAMPLIRYKLGDIGSASLQRCACGRGLPLMNVIEGRDVDCVVMPDGTSRSPIQFLVSMDKLGDLALEYQFVQTSLQQFVLRLVPSRELTAADRDRLAGILSAHHPGASMEIEQVAHLEREPSGKRRAFVSRL